VNDSGPLPPALHIVFSAGPAAGPAGQFDRWYGMQLPRILGVPGFAAVARYDLVPALDEPAEPDRFTSAAVYEIEGMAAGAVAGPAAGVWPGRMDLPGWLGPVRVCSWLATALGERKQRGGAGGAGGEAVPQSLQLVFSEAGDADRPVPDDSLDGWYEQHLDEILSIPGFTSAQRYRLTAVTRPEAGTIPGRRLCVYTTTKPPAELRAEMERMNLLSAASYSRLKDSDQTGPALPEWWDTVRFASWNLIPASRP
jgi:hypothetical protein